MKKSDNNTLKRRKSLTIYKSIDLEKATFDLRKAKK